jgi:hypothetical protein
MSDDFTRAECASCAAPIIWAVTAKAKRMPVNFEPGPAGNVVLEWRGGPVPLARVVSVPRDGLRTSHFVTCKDAKSWRRRGAREVSR